MVYYANLVDSLFWAICSNLLCAPAAPQPSTSGKATATFDEIWLAETLAMNHAGWQRQDCHNFFSFFWVKKSRGCAYIDIIVLVFKVIHL
jgi:hypothetical protein